MNLKNVLILLFLISIVGCKKEDRNYYSNNIYLKNGTKSRITFITYRRNIPGEYPEGSSEQTVYPDSSFPFEIMQDFYKTPQQQFIAEYDSIFVHIDDTAKIWTVVKFYPKSVLHYSQNLFTDDVAWKATTSKWQKEEKRQTTILTTTNYTFEFDTLNIQ